MCIRYRLPIGTPYGERCRTAGGAACAVNMEDLVGRNAQVVAEGRRPRLRVTKILFIDDRNLVFEVFQRLQMGGVESGVVPFALVKGRVLIGVAAHQTQT